MLDNSKKKLDKMFKLEKKKLLKQHGNYFDHGKIPFGAFVGQHVITNVQW